MGSLALIKGNIITLDDRNPRVSGVLVEDGLITGTGSAEEIAAAARERGIECIDLGGKTVLPGLHDAHVHAMGTGLNSSGIDVYDCVNIADLLEKVAEAAKEDQEGWIYCSRLDESRLAEKRPPTMEEIDKVVKDQGVFMVDRGLHYTLVNSKAFHEIGFTMEESGLILGPDGKPNGRLHDKANGKARSFFYDHRMTDRQRETMYDYTMKEAVKKGITTIHAMEGGDMFSDKDIPVFCKMQSSFPLDAVLYWDSEDVEAMHDLGLPRTGTDMLLDGSIGSRTAAFDEPYCDDPSSNGVIYFTKDFVVDHITQAHRYGMQAGFHAIGQRGIRFLLDCLEESLKIYPCEGHRFRIEHFGFCDDRDIERAARMGCVISTQPSYSFLRGGPGSVYNLRVGDERERRAYPLRKFLDAGIKLAGGSDSGATPMDSILGIHSALHQSYPENNITIDEAIRMFTIDAAYCAFEEKIKGSIEIGKQGDFTVLDKDPYEIDPDRLIDLSVEMTVTHGNIVYKKDS